MKKMKRMMDGGVADMPAPVNAIAAPAAPMGRRRMTRPDMSGRVGEAVRAARAARAMTRPGMATGTAMPLRRAMRGGGLARKGVGMALAKGGLARRAGGCAKRGVGRGKIM